MSQTTPPSLPRLTDARLTLEGRVATLTLARHDVRNALTGTALVEDIVAVAQWVNACDAVSVLVITGEGSAFSAGGNVKDMANRGGDFAGDVAEVSARYRRGIQRIPLALAEVEVPIIAAVNGPAIGHRAGFDLANMADIRIASKKAKFGETFLNLGIIPGDGGAWFMQRLIGYQRAFELTLTGRVIDAEEAKAYGIVLDVCEPEALMATAGELAARIAAQPPKATRLTKRLMKMAQRTELKDFLDLCAVFQGMCHNEPEHLEAVNAMLEKIAK
ncbi:enoyl-CoA hydratase-related protein [Halomonas alkalicola]|uniref:Enoyl-CoA hydratase-related protein n=1 Tax=Halomonas alkalicola TaxID=1930622 RepID=A0ABY9H3X6_9GAMM|nr:enoyl-CoA hydratase-related protein [Halomonas alkalicola]WLI73176.1 enoyl-CoA hydratase-related protein [Halomonas alkalicola]